MLTRRNLLKGAAAGVPIAMGSVASWPATALAQAGTKTFVLAHGSWHGGWCWKKVADRLRAKGHAVYTPSDTGMGDRAHLLSQDITINTFAEDLVQVIQSEELSNVILVGHSFGGVPISGAADRVPEKRQQSAANLHREPGRGEARGKGRARRAQPQWNHHSQLPCEPRLRCRFESCAAASSAERQRERRPPCTSIAAT
jgi:pimeloyl-ACP methyl ester carboxylesterase